MVTIHYLLCTYIHIAIYIIRMCVSPYVGGSKALLGFYVVNKFPARRLFKGEATGIVVTGHVCESCARLGVVAIASCYRDP